MGVAVGWGVGADGRVIGLGKVTGVTVGGNWTRVAVGCGMAVGSAVAVGMAAKAVATRSSTSLSISLSLLWQACHKQECEKT